MSSIKASKFGLNSSENTSIIITANDLDMSISANGKEAIRIDSNARVGIGLSTPTSNLHVIGTANISNTLIVNGGTLFVDAPNNEVGIGITNPTSNLHVIGTANITGNVIFSANLVGRLGFVNASGNLIATGYIRDDVGDVRDIGINNQSASYLLLVADAGKVISLTTGNVFVPNAVFSAGQAVSVYNNSAASITITQNSSVTMYLGGTSTTGNRTLAQRGVATILCVAANTFVVSGAGLT